MDSSITISSVGRKRHVLLGVVLAFLFAGPYAKAQYYDRREYEASDARYLYVGFMQRDFKPSSVNRVADSLAIAFNRPMPFVGFHQGPVDIVFGYSLFTLQGASRSTIFFGTTVSNEIILSGVRSNALLLPVMLSVDFTKAESNGAERDNFNIASLGIGAGVKYRYHNASVDFSIQAVEAAHYSFEGLSTGSGFSAATLGEATLILKDVAVLDGIVVGYRFRFQTWSMVNDRFDYKSLFHGPFIGLMF